MNFNGRDMTDMAKISASKFGAKIMPKSEKKKRRRGTREVTPESPIHRKERQLSQNEQVCRYCCKRCRN